MFVRVVPFRAYSLSLLELLGQRTRRSNQIKGIHIQGSEEVKLTQYADDTTAILADVQSVSNLFELLSSNQIKGIHIQGNEEVKLTQYADDTTAILADVQSVSNLFELLSSFEKCSGLKINRSGKIRNALACLYAP